MRKHTDHTQCCRPEASIGWRELGEKLRAKSLKLTNQRRSLLEVLRNYHHPISPQELHSRLSAGVCDLATVYRSMHLLEKADLVRRYDFGDGVTRFELVRERGDAHHHHLVCIRCSAIVEIQECTIEEFQKQLATRYNFKAVSHRLEFFGICPDCQ
jgi:Fur family transcriptional regulator, ferric uptake regulator